VLVVGALFETRSVTIVWKVFFYIFF